MIDIHSHILFNVDDGAESADNSIAILKRAEKNGFTDIILTPHYIEGQYENNRAVIKYKMQKLKELAYRENIEVALHIGNEIFLSENTPYLIQNGVESTLANTRYVLFEVPFTSRMVDMEEIVSQLVSLGCIPIIAHPERYLFIQEDPSFLIRLMKIGAYAQVNYGSFIGMYGKAAKKTVEVLLEKKLIQFAASDTHKKGKVYDCIDKIIKRMIAITNDVKYVKEITKYNPERLLNDFDLDVDIPSRM